MAYRVAGACRTSGGEGWWRLSGVSEWALADRVGMELLMGDTSEYTILNFPDVPCKPPD